MNENNVIMAALGGSGATLACYLLNKLQNTVALDEPMDVLVFPKLKNHDTICDEIDHFFKETRRSIRTRKTAISKSSNVLFPENPAGEQHCNSGLRVSNVNQFRSSQEILLRDWLYWRVAEFSIKKELTPDFILAINHPSAFTALLESLIKRFPCYAMIRNPLCVLAEWNSVKITRLNGFVPAAESLDINLADSLHRIEDKTARQLYQLSWFFEKYKKVLPEASILRYEDVVSSGGKALSIITPQAQELNEIIENKNKLYDRKLMQFLGDKLLKTGGPFWDFYTKKSVELLLED